MSMQSIFIFGRTNPRSLPKEGKLANANWRLYLLLDTTCIAILAERTQSAAIETIVEADPLATCVPTIMGERSSWSGSASDLLRLFAESDSEDATIGRKTRGHSQVGCDARRRFCACWTSRSRSAAKGDRERE